MVETAKQIKEFIHPIENKPLKDNRQTMNCNNIQTKTIPRSTRLQLENENIEGKSFIWKSNHVETTKPICTILKVETTDKHDTDRMTASDFSATFSQFKEGSRPINETKAPIRGNLGSKMGLIRKHAKIILCEFEFKNQ